MKVSWGLWLALLLTTRAAAQQPPPPPQRVQVAVLGFHAIGVDAVTAGLLAQRFAAQLAQEGLQLRSLAVLAGGLEASQRRELEGCQGPSEGCLRVLRAVGVQALLMGAVTYLEGWQFSARAVDTRGGATLASAREASFSRGGLEQRLDQAGAQFARRLRENAAKPAETVREGEPSSLGRTVISLAPFSLLLGDLFLEFEQVLTQHLSLLLGPGLSGLYPGVLNFALDPEVSLELSARLYPNGSAPERCWLALGVTGALRLDVTSRRLGVAGLVGCTVAIAGPVVATGAIGARVWSDVGPSLDGRLHLGFAF